MKTTIIEIAGFKYEQFSDFSMAESLRALYKVRCVAKKELYLGMQATLDDNGLGYQVVATPLADQWISMNLTDCPPLWEALCEIFLRALPKENPSDPDPLTPFDAVFQDGESGVDMLVGFFINSFGGLMKTKKKQESSEASVQSSTETSSGTSPLAETN